MAFVDFLPTGIRGTLTVLVSLSVMAATTGDIIIFVQYDSVPLINISIIMSIIKSCHDCQKFNSQCQCQHIKKKM